MSLYPELVFHIGAGKTGSTSIQFALLRNEEVLAAHRTSYFGLMLEKIPGALAYDWCQEGTPVNFFRTPPPDRARVAQEVKSVVLARLQDLRARGFTRAIWSNEAFLSRSDRILAIVRSLSEAGVPIRLIAYVRRHDKWARSAYVQFGLKGKSYPGPLRPFKTWVKDWSNGFASDLQTWDQAFPGKLEIYNFDMAPDVVSHFCGLLNLTGVESLRANESPSNALLAAWSVFNDQHAKPVMPEAFNRVAAALQVQGPRESTVPPLDRLLPGTDELLALQSEVRPDFDRINAMLVARHQPPLAFDRPDDKRREAEPWEIDRLMFQMIFALQKQVVELQDEVKKLGGGAGRP